MGLLRSLFASKPDVDPMPDVPDAGAEWLDHSMPGWREAIANGVHDGMTAGGMPPSGGPQGEKSWKDVTLGDMLNQATEPVAKPARWAAVFMAVQAITSTITAIGVVILVVIAL